MKEQTTITNFGTHFSTMFLRRIADLDTFAPLHSIHPYQEAQAEYSALRDQVFDQDNAIDASVVQAIINALHCIQDLEMEYLYRLGIQEGMRIREPEFLTEGMI